MRATVRPTANAGDRSARSVLSPRSPSPHAGVGAGERSPSPGSFAMDGGGGAGGGAGGIAGSASPLDAAHDPGYSRLAKPPLHAAAIGGAGGGRKFSIAGFSGGGNAAGSSGSSGSAASASSLAGAAVGGAPSSSAAGGAPASAASSSSSSASASSSSSSSSSAARSPRRMLPQLLLFLVAAVGMFLLGATSTTTNAGGRLDGGGLAGWGAAGPPSLQAVFSAQAQQQHAGIGGRLHSYLADARALINSLGGGAPAGSGGDGSGSGGNPFASIRGSILDALGVKGPGSAGDAAGAVPDAATPAVDDGIVLAEGEMAPPPPGADGGYAGGPGSATATATSSAGLTVTEDVTIEDIEERKFILGERFRDVAGDGGGGSGGAGAGDLAAGFIDEDGGGGGGGRKKKKKKRKGKGGRLGGGGSGGGRSGPVPIPPDYPPVVYGPPHPQIVADLAPWANPRPDAAGGGGVTLEELTALVGRDMERPVNQRRLVLVYVINNRLVLDYDNWGSNRQWAAKLSDFAAQLSSVLRAPNVSVPDVVFVAQLASVPYLRKAPRPGDGDGGAGTAAAAAAAAAAGHPAGPPVFSMAKSDGHWDVLYPNPYFGTWDRWERSAEGMLRLAGGVPWEARASVAFWRGSCVNWPGSRPRVDLVMKHAASPKLDVAFIRPCPVRQWPQLLPDRSSDRLLKSTIGGLPRSRIVSRSEFARYKFLFHMPGSTQGSYSRNMQVALGVGSVVLKWDNPFYEFFYGTLLPWRHYVPVNASTAVPVVEYLASHDEQARAIASATAAWYDRNLRGRNIRDYWVQLLSAYARLQRFTPTPPANPCSCDKAVDRGPLRRCKVC
jgi:hypothetical protein